MARAPGGCLRGPSASPSARKSAESTDALFRPIAAGKRPDTAAYRALLRVHQELLAGERLQVGDAGIEIGEDGRPSFAVLLTQSALRLAASPELRRLRICPNCHWLFIDRSRNASRRWCDMLTCGNRAKAERHQRRRSDTHKPVNSLLEVSA